MQGVIKIKSHHHTEPKNVEQLKAALMKGPVAVSVDSNSDFFKQYQGGIIDWENCGTNVGHTVLAIGYGNEDSPDGEDYLIIKNSWGQDWGEMGFARISLTKKFGSKGICGVLSQGGYYATLNGEPVG